MSDELPPLPEPGIEKQTDDCTYWCDAGYTADQMRAYARAARAQVWREAADVCDDIGEGNRHSDAHDCAAAIRARAEKEQG